MKTLLLAALVFGTSLATAQTSATMSSTYQPADHAERASTQALQAEVPIASQGVTTAHGEVPLSEISLPASPEEPLGDVARRYKRPARDIQTFSAQPILRESTAFPHWWLAY